MDVFKLFHKRSDNYKNPPVPLFYTHVRGEWNNGFTITDGKNFWTWIPVGALKDGFVRRAYEYEELGKDGYYTDYANESWFLSVLKMIKKFGGFYVSTYLISGDEKNPVSAPHAKPFTSVNYATAFSCASKMGIEDISQTHLLCAEEADSINAYLMELDLANYIDFGDAKGGKFGFNSDSESIVLTGDDAETGGIYGWVGNTWKWTQERHGKFSRAVRYSASAGNNQLMPVTFRMNAYPDERNESLGFMVVLVFD